MTETKKRSPLKIIGWVLGGIVAFVALVLLAARWYFRLPVAAYYRNSEKAFVIPGIGDGLVFQGLDYDEDSGLFFITGYRTDGGASQVLLVDRESGKECARVELRKADGGAETGHVGGIVVHGDYVYVAGSRCIHVYERSRFLDAPEDGACCIGDVSTAASGEDYVGVAFLAEHEGLLYVGEFYREQNYPTLDSHKLTTGAGDWNPALMLAFRLDDGAEFGVSGVVEAAYSIPALAQGVSIDGDRIYLSTSYATAFSHIYAYDVSKLSREGTITVLGQTVPLLALDSASLAQDIKAPPMSEEIVEVDGWLYTMCESATNKYIFGKFTSARFCYATDLSKYGG